MNEGHIKSNAEYRNLARTDLNRYLNASLALPELCLRMEAKRAEIETIVKSPKPANVQESHDDNYTKLLDELCDMGIEYAGKINESKLICLQTERRISKLGGIYGAILYRRYCELKEWSVICCELREIIVCERKPFVYNDSTIYRRHDEALIEYGRKIENAD